MAGAEASVPHGEHNPGPVLGSIPAVRGRGRGDAMTALPLLVLTLLGSYLVGAVPFGYLVACWRGMDILRQGSGNIGATNVGRLLGRRFGALVFLLDFAKGALPVLAASRWAPDPGPGWPPDTLPVAAGLTAFLGHLFPVYL